MEPNTKASDYVYCYWELKSVDTAQEPFIYRVVSNSCNTSISSIISTNKSYNGKTKQNEIKRRNHYIKN